MKLEQRAKIYGAIGTIFFHIVFLLLLWFLVMSRIVPDGEDGLAVRLGTGGGGDGGDGNSGLFEPVPAYEVPDLPLSPVEAPSLPGEKELQTQNMEETVSLSDSKKKKSDEEIRREQEQRAQQQQQELARQEELRKAAEARAQQEAQNRRAQEIRNQTGNLFGGNGSGGSGTSSGSPGTGGGQGGGQGSGTPGNPFGSPGATGTEGNGTGSSGTGTGSSSYSLADRALNGILVRPSYNVYEEGKIVVNIIVDKDGAVINAEVGSGTNIDNPTLRNAAKEAARKTKFNKITTDKNQSGTITYIFKLQ